MDKSITVSLLVLGLLLAGCDRDRAGAGSAAPATAAGEQAVPPGGDSERTWAGLLPCSDCQGVDTRLVLRSQGGRRTYLLTETYLGAAGPRSFDRTGAWSEQTRSTGGETLTFFTLDPEQGGQRYRLQSDGSLEALDGNGAEPSQAIAYRLQRL